MRVQYVHNLVLVRELLSIFKGSIILSLCCKVSPMVKKKSYYVLVSFFHALKIKDIVAYLIALNRFYCILMYNKKNRCRTLISPVSPLF